MEENNYIESLKKRIVDNSKRCRTCNFCYTVCPVYESSRGFLTRGPSGMMASIYYAVVWDMLNKRTEDSKALRDILSACTTCGSCNIICKSSGPGTPVVEVIEAGRSLLVELMLGPLPEHVKVLESLQQFGNPYHEAASKRLDWFQELNKDFKTKCRIVPEEGPVDVLLYVGCSASYNADIQKIARSVVMLMEKMDIRFGVLKEEKCCGSPAKQIGEQGLFEELSGANVQSFRATGARTIVTISPHCYHSFMNEYPDGMREFEVRHFTDFFSKSIEDKRIIPKLRIEKTVAYHDPCYLGKKNSLYAPPRKILGAIPGIQVVELKRSKENCLCCGGGGGRMWLDIEEAVRPSQVKVEEALAVGAQVLVTACPWCHLQIEDAIKTSDREGKLEAKDISELLLSSLSCESQGN